MGWGGGFILHNKISFLLSYSILWYQQQADLHPGGGGQRRDEHLRTIFLHEMRHATDPRRQTAHRVGEQHMSRGRTSTQLFLYPHVVRVDSSQRYLHAQVPQKFCVHFLY